MLAESSPDNSACCASRMKYMRSFRYVETPKRAFALGAGAALRYKRPHSNRSRPTFTCPAQHPRQSQGRSRSILEYLNEDTFEPVAFRCWMRPRCGENRTRLQPAKSKSQASEGTPRRCHQIPETILSNSWPSHDDARLAATRQQEASRSKPRSRNTAAGDTGKGKGAVCESTSAHSSSVMHWCMTGARVSI